MAKSKVQTPEVVDTPVKTALTAELEIDQVFVANVGLAIKEFLANAATFFKGAAELEKDAASRLVEAKRLTVPTTTEQDQAMQQFTVASNNAAKQAEGYWYITQTLHGWHKKSTEARARAVDPNKRAGEIANAHHLEFVRLDAIRVREAQRLEDERVARVQEELRQKELNELEAARLKAEADSPDLSGRETVFLDTYAQFGYTQATRAAANAGYRDPVAMAARLLASDKMMQAIRARQASDALKRQAAAVKVAPPPIVQTNEIKSNVVKAAGVRGDRTTWTGVVDNAEQFIAAVFEGKHGIPRTLLMINPVVLNEYATSMNERMDAWPGVHAQKNTKTL